MSELVSFVEQGHVALIRLNRPEKLNALNREMFLAINAVIERLSTQCSIRAVVLTGEGRAFCAGLDMAAMAAGGVGFSPLDRDYGLANTVQNAAWGWRTLPMPVIAAVHGVAFGGGLQIMSGADIRIGHAATRLSIRETKWGLVPDMAGMALWKGLVRDDVLRELAYTAREFDGVEAERAGFLTRLATDPLETAMQLAGEIAERSPDAIAALKRLCNLAAESDAAAILKAESLEQSSLKRTANQIEAVSAQLERRSPKFLD